MNNNNNRQYSNQLTVYLDFRDCHCHFVGMFNGDQKGPIADISYTKFMQV